MEEKLTINKSECLKKTPKKEEKGDGDFGQKSDIKLTWIHLRYFPPGLILEYFDETKKRSKERTIDLLDFHARSKLSTVIDSIMKEEPLFNKFNKPTLVNCLWKLKMRCRHDFSKIFTPNYRLIRAHSMPMLGACISRSGEKGATFGFDKTCKIWCSDGKEFQTLTGHYDAVSCGSFDSKGEKFLTGSYDGTLRLWQIDEQETNSLLILPGPSGEVQTLQFSGDNLLCAAGTNGRCARVYDLTNGASIHTFKGHNCSVCSVDFDRHGTTLLTGSYDSKLGLWDLRSGQLIAFLIGHEGEITKTSFNFESDKIVSSSVDRSVRLWDCRCTNTCVAVFKENSSQVLDVQFNSTGSEFASGSKNGRVVIWSTPQSKKLSEIQAHKGAVNRVSFSSSGGFLLTCSDDNTAKIWNAEHWSFIQTLAVHQDSVFYAAFNYLGDGILTASKDNTAQFWK